MRCACHLNATRSFLQHFGTDRGKHPVIPRCSRLACVRARARLSGGPCEDTLAGAVSSGERADILSAVQCGQGRFRHTEPACDEMRLPHVFFFPFSPAEPHMRHPGPYSKWSHSWLALQHGGQNPIQLRVRLRIGRTQHPHMHCVTWQWSTVGLPITFLQR